MEEGIRDVVSTSDLVTPAGCASCISRRTFMKQSALVAALAVVASNCAGADGISDPAGLTQITVSDFPALANVGTLVLVDGQRSVKRTGATTFAAFSRRCTHEGSAVGLSGSGFLCPNHGARFDNNGHVTLGPANRDLTTLTTSYDQATDTLTIG
jgi:Rieske Fe-S protein